MKIRCLSAACSLALAVAAPVWAAPAAPPVSALPEPAVAAPAGSSAQPVLDSLVGKKEVLQFTKSGGRQFLGRVLSGDHGLYVVQTFHYVTAPATVTETTPETTATVGRRGRVSYRTKKVKTRETIQKTVPDAAAVSALLRGVGGPSFRPAEQLAGREMIAPAEIATLQVLRPPKAAKAAAPAASAAPAAAPAADWTLRTLWPLTN